MKSRKLRNFMTLAVIAASAALLLAAGVMYKTHRAERGTPLQTGEGSSFCVHFFDVGEADAALVECDGRCMLIDGGDPEDAGLLQEYFRRNRIARLDYVVCTHAHSDHVGGLAGALDRAKAGAILSPVEEYDSWPFRNFAKAVAAQGKSITVPSPGTAFSLGSAEVTILAPVDPGLGQEDLNDACIVLRIVYGDTSFLFTADAEEAEELSILRSGAAIRSTLIKVGHHGSALSSSEGFLDAVRPAVAVISAGKDNDFGHPHDALLRRLGRCGAQIYRTDLQGEIVCISDGSRLSVTTER